MKITSVACLLVAACGVAIGAAPSREQLTFDLGQLRLTAVAWGQGETVILLPGLGRSADSFETFGPELASRGFRVIALNPRGVSGSTGELKGLTLHDYASDVAQVIRKVSKAPAHLVGWAQGNRIARTAAADHRDLVRSVVLIAAGGRVPGDPEASAALGRLAESGLPDDERRRLMSIALFAPGFDPSPFVSLYSSIHPEARAAQTAANQATPLSDWWAGGVAPLLVIQGLQDRLAPVANGRALKDEVGPRAQLIEVANAGHAVLLEQPALVLDHVSTFLTAHPIAKLQ